MAPLLLLGGLTLASLPTLLRRLGRRSRQPEWAHLCLATLVGGAVLVEVGALLWAAPSVLRMAGVPALAMACDRLLGPLLPLGTVGGAVGAGIAVLVPFLAWRGGRRAQAQAAALAIEAVLGHHEHRGGYDLVVLPTRQRLAYSVATPRPQVVISEGLCQALSGEQVDAVVAHEVAHLSHRHPLLLGWASVAAASLAWWPVARRSHRVLRAAFERWADEQAIAGDEARADALTEAIVAAAVTDQPVAVAAFSLADATAERIAAMHDRRSASLPVRVSIYVPGIVALVVASVATVAWMSQAQLVLAMAGRCTI